MGMILRIASSRIVGQGDIVGRSGYFSLNLSANSVMRGRLDARRTLKSLVADLRFSILSQTEVRLRDSESNFIPTLLHAQFKFPMYLSSKGCVSDEIRLVLILDRAYAATPKSPVSKLVSVIRQTSRSITCRSTSVKISSVSPSIKLFALRYSMPQPIPHKPSEKVIGCLFVRL